MIKNKRQKRQRAAAAAAMDSSSKSNEIKQLDKQVAPLNCLNHQPDPKRESLAAASSSQDSIVGTIIKGLKGCTIDSRESVALENDKVEIPNDRAETGPGQSNTEAEFGGNSGDNEIDVPPHSESDLDSEWEQVDINGRIKDMDDSSTEEDNGNTIRGISKAKAATQSLEQDYLDREWEHVEAETQNDDTVFNLEADRHLCILWFFTTHSFSTMASLLNYSLSKPLAIRIHGQDAKDRFLELAKSSNYPRAFVYHEVKRLSETKGVDWQPAVQQMDRVFTRAWDRMHEDMSVERELGEEREHYDNVSDVEYVQNLGESRLWSVEERKVLQGRPWGGLGAKVTRPVGDELGSHLGIHVQGVREAATTILGRKKKKGLLGLGMFGL